MIELRHIRQSLGQGLLNQVVGIAGISMEAPGKSAKGRNEVHYFAL